MDVDQGQRLADDGLKGRGRKICVIGLSPYLMVVFVLVCILSLLLSMIDISISQGI